MNKQQFKQYIETFDFTTLFNLLGWAFIKETTPVKANEETYTLQSVAEKSGFRIIVCQPDKNGNIPEHPIRLKIDNQVSTLFKEHLLIFINKNQTQQVWQTVHKEISKPAKLSTVNWSKGQEPELLYQKAGGLIFTLEEEDIITIVDVVDRVSENFYQNTERVTKQFYDRFKKEHTSFLSFIKGIDGKADKDWYASLMLNRLMFCYFIQKKGFLDQNKNYLRDKLNLCKEKKGKDKFYSFYRSFLLVLFHEGLNEPAQKEKIKVEIGKIPYLNGGLFDEHELEKSYEIDIDDKAFERLFDFFDQYEWHLDTRITASGNDINPDVIGYIFEKYINDRAQMGAYYTKEDITDYISKNCIIPWLFDETARHYTKAFGTNGEIWTGLKASTDKYIYDAVKFGIDEPLPKEIAVGIKDVAKRTEWNKPAPANVGLPNEIWREVVERRNRFGEVKSKIEKGEITAINDFITLNLNIRQFTQDVIENSNDADFIKAFYKALNNMTIIDPTCGSGAFLFAAMNILEPLYHACIMRMQAFTEDEDRENELKKKTFNNKYKYFKEVLENIQSEQHPNLEYFIYKTIILNNLYGVDIMKEAVEIAKLRLFLKLVATVDADYKKPNLGLEPLPDIDFNIRAGNTLVGFASKAELKTGSLDFQEDEKKVLEQMEKVSMAFKRFKKIQLSGSVIDYADFKTAKDDYQKRLNELKENLNKSFYNSFGNHKIGYKKWLTTHQPFHWFAEFYEIIHGEGGFDAIIGNPPYVEYKDVKNVYTISGYSTLPCGDLYAFCTERSINFLKSNGVMGLIIPISIFGTDGFKTLQNSVKRNLDQLWVSTFSNRPSQLFDGAQKRLTIIIGRKAKNASQIIFTTTYLRWKKSEFVNLFSTRIKYASSNNNFSVFPESLEKLGSNLELNAFKKIILIKGSMAAAVIKTSSYKVYYTRKFGYFLSFLNFIPEVIQLKDRKRVIPSELKDLGFASKDSVFAVISALSSSTFFWFWNVLSDCRNLNKRDLLAFTFNPDSISVSTKNKLSILGEKYIQTLSQSSKKMIKSGLEIQTFDYSNLKPIIDEIDKILAKHYEFTDEELDFIINYDLKYRMGKELEGEGEE